MFIAKIVKRFEFCKMNDNLNQAHQAKKKWYSRNQQTQNQPPRLIRNQVLLPQIHPNIWFQDKSQRQPEESRREEPLQVTKKPRSKRHTVFTFTEY